MSIETTEETADRLRKGDKRMDDLQAQIDSLREAINENTRLTQEVRDSTSGLVEVLDALRGGMRVIELLGRIARPVGWVAGAWAAYKASRLGGWR